MNLKNISIILAFLSLNVISSPINNIVSEEEVTAVGISDVEISADEIVEVNVDADTVLENDDDSDSDIDLPEVPSDPENNIDEENSDLPCNSFNDCVDWIENNIDEINLLINPKLSNETLQYVRDHYQDGKPVEILKQKYDAIDYGIKVDVNGHKMSVNIKGEENEKTIVFLPGYGVLSPVIFYRNITDSLSNGFRVVTIEPFGYGLSDVVKEERTASNIASEIHTCLQKLGIDKFYLMAHSFGGIYSAVYDHTYPGELLGFIGLDNTPSNFGFPSEAYPDLFNTLFRVFDRYHMLALFPEEMKRQISTIDMELEYQNYTEEEIKDLEIIYTYRNGNSNIVDESILMSESTHATLGIYFQCPLLMFMSTDMSADKSVRDWELLHKKMITNPETSEAIMLEGTHGFLHSEYKEYIYNKIKEWIN